MLKSESNPTMDPTPVDSEMWITHSSSTWCLSHLLLHLPILLIGK